MPDRGRRETARRILVEREARTVTPLLSETARSAESAVARANALAALDGLGALSAGDVEGALADASWGLRRFALRLADAFLRKDDRLIQSVLALRRDPDPAVRLQLALTLGESRDPRALGALASLATRHGDERWMDTAIASSAAQTAAELLAGAGWREVNASGRDGQRGPVPPADRS